jgi:hypothetical protein
MAAFKADKPFGVSMSSSMPDPQAESGDGKGV